MKQSNAAQDVETALTLLRQQVTRPQALFDPHTTMAALELLIDSCRAKGDQRLTRYNTILKQTRSMVGHPSLQNVFLKLVGSKEEVEVSREIQKALKHSHQPQAPFPPRPLPAQGRWPPQAAPYPRARPTCFVCHRRGHIARSCPNNNNNCKPDR